MRWFGRGESSNVEDRRGWGGRGFALGGGGGLVLLLISMFLGVDPGTLVNTEPSRTAATRATDPAEDELASFAKVIFRDTEVIWDEIFRDHRQRYSPPTLVLFTEAVRSACGSASSAVGPFYCPRDSKIYIDLSFYRDMDKKLEAPGDFARAYVLAHEVGHHVQRLLGFAGGTGNQASVGLELQADFLAGVWAHHAQKKYQFLESGDLDEALNAAFQIGDDRLQMKARGYVVPDSFTHGSSAQRKQAFLDGFETGDLRRASSYARGASSLGE